MALGYSPKNELTQGQALRVQQLKVRGQDAGLYSTSIPNNTGSVCIYIREPVNAIVDAVSVVDATGVSTRYSVSLGQCSIIDSNGALSGTNEQGVAVSDQGAIKLSSLASLASDDTVTVNYIVQEHL
jgi:hypothetical protein